VTRLMTLLWLLFPGLALADRQEIRLGDRSYIIDLPAQPMGAPMILGLHGGGGNPAQFARNSGLSGPANTAGYAVIYPAGTGRLLLTWNGGYCCGAAADRRVDDIAFLDQVIRDATRRFALDGRRVYLTGMSNGSLMAEAYAATRPAAVKAVAGVSGTVDLAAFPVTGAVPLLHIHGTDDPHVPFDGGQGSESLTDTDFNAVADVMAAFRKAQGPGLTEVTRVIDPADDGMTVLETTWSKRDNPVLRLLAIRGGGHVWPGGRRAERQGGTADITANAEILRFFAEHP
jgi:polyhydroxybutyrate depolymerase